MAVHSTFDRGLQYGSAVHNLTVDSTDAAVDSAEIPPKQFSGLLVYPEDFTETVLIVKLLFLLVARSIKSTLTSYTDRAILPAI